ncbi:MAG: hypothetical protein ACP5O5_00725, partial [Fervidicoccaceae archaeon]
IPIILYRFLVASRDFHLAHRSRAIAVGSWVAVEPNGTRLPSRGDLPRLGAVLPSPRRILRRFQTATTSLC